MKIRPLSPLLVVAMAVCCVHGCEESSTPPPIDYRGLPWPPQTSPENVLRNLERSFAERDIARFDSLLYDAEAAGDTVEGFVIRFWDQDVEQGNVPDPEWGREEAIQQVVDLFTSAEVDDIDLDLTWSDPYQDNTYGHEGQWIVYGTWALRIITRPPNSTEPVTHDVGPNLARVRFKCQYVSAQGDSIWRAIYVEDLSASP